MLFLKLANYIDLQAFCDEKNFESNEKIIELVKIKVNPIRIEDDESNEDSD